MTRRYDARRARSSLSYTCAELAELFEVSIFTVDAWVKDGLRPIDGKRPHLFAGVVVAAFLSDRNKPRQPLQDGQIFCVACKGACFPQGAVADVVPRSARTADIIGTCPSCSRRVFRRIRFDELGRKTANLTLRHEEGSIALGQCGDRVRTAACEEFAL